MACGTYRYLALARERIEQRGIGASPTVREVSEASGDSVRAVARTFRAAEGKLLVELSIPAGQTDEDAIILLSPGAHVLLERHQ